jgi:glycosyltransferase involved in cell wall biosynthesis
MDILFIFHERNNGGACRCALSLLKELSERGHCVTAVIPFRRGTLRSALEELSIPYRVVFFAWWMMPSYWHPLFKIAFRALHWLDGIAATRIARMARRLHADVIHSNSSAIDVGARAAVLAGLPHVWHVREFGDLDYQLEFLAGKSASCRFMAAVPGAVLFVSRALREHYRGLLPDNLCHVVYDGIPPEYAIDKAQGAASGETVFLLAGNVQEGKGQRLAVEAARILHGRGRTGFRLLLAGAPTSMKLSRAYAEEVKELAANLPEGVVEFAGYVRDMNALRARADVELVCSASEAFGRVTVEAMLASNPVIASDSGASPELVADGETGLLFPAGDVEALADRMERLIGNPSLVRAMGEAAQRRAKKNFLSSRNTDQVEGIYRALAGAPRQGF